ncbi:cytochrome P450 family protein [Aspergillus tubingensis]|uniref:cytochrome P450 family protein n=1 Tax=Aspergillus tubingensis TaxID=5068 RepID=UPI00157A188D|nr:cytochrome P450 family protein [Aspergillus tubingensis]GFN16507.1 cytochrome P450 family protein [Aspergillus tubingensis]
MHFHQRFALIISTLITAAAAGQSRLPEQLFLDLPVAEVLNRTAWDLVEPWATEYCTAIAEQRYGDAIYARYNIFGETTDGMLTLWDCTDEGRYRERNITVYEQIMEDARGYHDGHLDLYQEALDFYSSNSPNDSRRDIIEALNNVMNNGSDF